MTPYGDINPGQHYPRYWPLVQWHRAITWTNIDLSSVKSSDIHLTQFHNSYLSHQSLKLTLTHRRWAHVNACRVSSCGGVFNMWLVPSITFHWHYNIWVYMCSTGPFQFRWLKGYIYSPCYYHHQIGSINLTHCYHIFPWLCAWDVCVTSYSVTYTYTFREDRDFVFIIIVQFMMSSNSRIRFDLQLIFSCLYITPSHYHHCAKLSEDIELIKCLSDIFCRVCE